MSVLPREEGKGRLKRRGGSRLGHMQDGPRVHTAQMATIRAASRPKRYKVNTACRSLLMVTSKYQGSADDSGEVRHESQREPKLALSQKTRSIRPEPFPSGGKGCVVAQ